MVTPQEILKSVFGYDSFRPLQRDAIESLLSGRDVFLLMPTGGGKSLCYQIPALYLPGITIVVSPLISLMQDQVTALQANGVEAAYYNSTLDQQSRQAVRTACLQGKLKLLYLSPETIKAELMSWIHELNVSFVAIDEAHCVSVWGHDFRPEYGDLKLLRNCFPNVAFMALTATADKATRKDIVKQLELQDPELYVASFDRPNLSLEVRRPMSKKNKVKEVVEFIRSRNGESGIIYCLSRKETENMQRAMSEQGIQAAVYHAGVPSYSRASIQDSFLKDDIQVICATVAFGMGIDKSNIRWVIHNNLPKNLESFYQEIGRAGRDGEEAETILYYSLADMMILNQFNNNEGELAEVNKQKLNRMLEYAEATCCRRKILLAYFNEYIHEDCGNCDVCTNPPSFFDGSIIVQKALSAVMRLNEQVGVTMLINVLRGSQNQELLNKGYHRIKTYGKGTEFSFDEWRQYITQMLNNGWLEIAYDENSVLKLTSSGKDVLYAKQVGQLTKPVEKKKKEKKKTAVEKVHDELFNLLKKARKTLADKEQIPAFMVFSDASLADMSAKQPMSQNEMLEVSGVGKHKWAKYGPTFLEVIKQFLLNSSSKTKLTTQEKTYILLQEGQKAEEIAKQRGIGIGTVYNHVEKLLQERRNLNIWEFVSKEEAVRIESYLIQHPEGNKLKEVYEAMGGEIPYERIRLALSWLGRGMTTTQEQKR